jgi:hypothetical protein
MAYRLAGNTTTAAPALVDLSPMLDMDRNVNKSEFSRYAEMPPARWRSILRSYPEHAQNVYKKLAAESEAYEAFHAAAHEQKQAHRQRHSKCNVEIRALNRQLDSAKKEHQPGISAQIADLQEEIAEICEAIATIDRDLEMRRPIFDLESVKLLMARNSSRAKRFKTFAPNLPVQSATKDERVLADVRAKVDDCVKSIRDVDLAPLPEESALEKAMVEIDKIAKGSAPDFSPLTRLAQHGFRTDVRTQGGIKWPTKHVRLDEFEPDPFRLLFWLFGDEIKERARAEIKKLQRPGALSLPERAERKAAIENERFELWRIEEALVTRLREAGRSDINYRREMPIQVLLRVA